MGLTHYLKKVELFRRGRALPCNGLRTAAGLSLFRRGMLSSSFVRRLAGLQVRVREDTVTISLSNGETFTAPRPRGLSDHEAISAMLYGVWYPVRWLDQYEAHRLLRPGNVVLDLGGNTGCYSLLAGRIVGDTGRVIAVEPVPGNAAALEANCASNGLRNVTVCPLAAGSTSGSLSIDVHDTLIGGQAMSAGSFATDLPVAETLTVELRHVDDLVADLELDRLSLIKMDVEGMELEALWGAADTIRRFRPAIVAATYHRPEDTTTLPAAILEICGDYDVELRTSFPDGELDLFAAPHAPAPE